MFERILVPLDGSETAEKILPHVRRLPLMPESEIHVLQVVPFSLSGPDGQEVGSIDQARRYVRRMTFQFVMEGIRAQGSVRVGAPALTILDMIRAERITMVALSTHGRTGFTRWLLGSVAESVLRESPVPVLVVRSLPAGSGQVVSRGRLERTPFRTIVVPLEEEGPSSQALAAVKGFARSCDARAVLLHVCKDPVSCAPLSEQAFVAAERELARECIPSSREQRTGNPADEILSVARERDADLVAMATHGRWGPSRWFFGSVTETVLRATAVPLLVVKAGTGAAGPASPMKEEEATSRP
jgi:nucleotide-binding universal stress UspA family protein